MIKQVHFLDFTNGLIEADKEKCRKILNDLLSEKTDIREIYVDLFQRSLYTIGKLWEKNELNVADEHLGTQIVEELVYECSLTLKNIPKNGRKVLITCIDKEFHKIGAKMASDIFELNGWATYFLGASTPTKEILRAIQTKKPDVVGLSFNFYLNMLKLFNVIEDIKKYFPGIKIIVGGQGPNIEKENILKKYNDIFFFNDIKELDLSLKNGLALS